MVTVNNEGKGTFTLNEDYYYWAQFSKFVERGAVRVESSAKWPLDSVAFKNPDGTIVAVVLNEEK
jgi:glucosylceramidase